ncbi:hypothetical protein ABZ499_11955 [Streptomyces sp. NPDC019990]|uniref:hypothetical protein n=1 Tax=Streptomyces sp. NPDC019990 TaxID=3154693 RepID=UPI0033CBED4C
MRKYQKAAVVAAMLGSVSFLGAGVSHAGGEGGKFFDSDQIQVCSADEVNIVGTDAGNILTATNAGGTQLIDQSETTSVRCGQFFGFGG